MNKIDKLLQKRKIKQLNNIPTDAEDEILFDEFGNFLNNVCSSDELNMIRKEQKRAVDFLYEQYNVSKHVFSESDVKDRLLLIIDLAKKVQQSELGSYNLYATILFNVFNVAFREIGDFCKSESANDENIDNRYSSSFNACLPTIEENEALITNILTMTNVVQDCCHNSIDSLTTNNYPEAIQYLTIASSAIFIIDVYAEKITD